MRQAAESLQRQGLTDLATRLAQIARDAIYVSNSPFKLEFSADALDLSNGLFEPLLVRRLDESGIVKMLGRLRRENVSQFELAVLPRPFGNRQRPRGVFLLAVSFEHIGHDNRQARSSCLIGNVTMTLKPCGFS